jgi:hypothetical protein
MEFGYFDFLKIQIQHNSGIISFRNESHKYKVIVSIIPKKPKRKYIDIISIPPQTNLLDESGLDLQRLSYRFET